MCILMVISTYIWILFYLYVTEKLFSTIKCYSNVTWSLIWGYLNTITLITTHLYMLQLGKTRIQWNLYKLILISRGEIYSHHFQKLMYNSYFLRQLIICVQTDPWRSLLKRLEQKPIRCKMFLFQTVKQSLFA